MWLTAKPNFGLNEWGKTTVPDKNIRSNCTSAIEALRLLFKVNKTTGTIQDIEKELNNRFKIS